MSKSIIIVPTNNNGTAQSKKCTDQQFGDWLIISRYNQINKLNMSDSLSTI